MEPEAVSETGGGQYCCQVCGDLATCYRSELQSRVITEDVEDCYEDLLPPLSYAS